MLKHIVSLLFVLSLVQDISAQEMITPFERSKGKESTTYDELITFYKKLDKKYSTIHMEEIGSTDTYEPLRVVYYTNDAHFDIDDWHKDGKVVLLINNGIHPG